MYFLNPLSPHLWIHHRGGYRTTRSWSSTTPSQTLHSTQLKVHDQVSRIILLLFTMDPKVVRSNQANCLLQDIPSAPASCWSIWESQEDDRRRCCHRYWWDHSLWGGNRCIQGNTSSHSQPEWKTCCLLLTNSSRQWTEASIHREVIRDHNRSGEALETLPYWKTLHPENSPEISVLHVRQASQIEDKEREILALETGTLLLQFWYCLSPC